MEPRLAPILRTVLRAATDLLYPPFCYACDADLAGADRADLCRFCLQSRLAVAHPCPRCAGPRGPGSAGKRCPRCRSARPGFRAATAAYLYGGAVAAMIARLKYGGERHQADPLGRWAARAAAAAPWAGSIEMVVPLPLSRSRRRERGFNQAELLAEPVAERLRARWRPGALRKIADTPPQAGLSREARRRNLAGAFRARERTVRGRRVLLVDDVMTTGTTLSEAARTLRRAGAKRVDVAVVARAV